MNIYVKIWRPCTVSESRKFSVVNTWMLRVTCDILRNFLHLFLWLTLDVFVICNTLSCLYHVSCFTPPVSHLLSPVSSLSSPVSHLLSHVSGLTSPVSRCLSPVSCLLSHVSCHHVSCLAYNFFEKNLAFRQTKLNLPLTKLINLSLEGKVGDFVNRRKCLQSMNYLYFLFF